MNEHEMHLKAVAFLKDYESYLDDHHLTMDTITGITCEEARNVLRRLRGACPHNLAKAMAELLPLDADRWDEVEHRVQQLRQLDDDTLTVPDQAGSAYSV